MAPRPWLPVRGSPPETPPRRPPAPLPRRPPALPLGGRPRSPKGPPQPHPRQAERDGGDAKPAAPHAKHGPALRERRALLLELRRAREVAVGGEAEEGAAPCAASVSGRRAARARRKRGGGGHSPTTLQLRQSSPRSRRMSRCRSSGLSSACSVGTPSPPMGASVGRSVGQSSVSGLDGFAGAGASTQTDRAPRWLAGWLVEGEAARKTLSMSGQPSRRAAEA